MVAPSIRTDAQLQIPDPRMWSNAMAAVFYLSTIFLHFHERTPFITYSLSVVMHNYQSEVYKSKSKMI